MRMEKGHVMVSSYTVCEFHVVLKLQLQFGGGDVGPICSDFRYF